MEALAAVGGREWQLQLERLSVSAFHELGPFRRDTEARVFTRAGVAVGLGARA